MFNKIPKIVFWLTCVTLAGYLVVLQFLKYFENADTPKISFKTLNESPEGEDVYPDITFCFTEYKSGDHIYNCTYLQEHHSLSACQYQNLLLGESRAWSRIPNPGRVADVNFEEASMDLKELIPQHKVVTHFGRTDSLNSQMELIDKQFQLPGMICFTRHFGTYLKKGDVLLSETFLFILPAYIKSALQIFIHYPGQLLRAIATKNRGYKAALKVRNEELIPVKETEEQDYRIGYDFKLTQMSVIKRRPDAVTPCDPKPTDDARLWKEFFSSLTCLPSYWKKFAPLNTTLASCKNISAFKKIDDWTNGKDQKGVDEARKIISSIAIPCNKMALEASSWQKNFAAPIRDGNSWMLSKAKKKKKADNSLDTKTTQNSEKNGLNEKAPKNSKGKKRNDCLKEAQKCLDTDTAIKRSEPSPSIFRFVYQMEDYQEIRNLKDYGLDNLWSNIGGFLGIFIGYSLVNLLTDGYASMAYFVENIRAPRNTAKIRHL